MSLLESVQAASARYDDVRTRWETAASGEGTILTCSACRRPLHDHAEGCIFTLLPKIVAAIEAAERLITNPDVLRSSCIAYPPGVYTEIYICQACGKDTIKHAEDCAAQALVAALTGEDVKA